MANAPSNETPAMEEPAFHAGERAAQARVGMADKMALVGQRAIRSFMPDQHREFFAELPFLLLGAADATGQVWASVLAQPPGFVQSPDPTQLTIDAMPLACDALAGALQPGAPVGLLGIQPHTRRRNRMNGVITALSPAGFSVAVRQSFGNCPKYIQAREARFAPRPQAGPLTVSRTAQLDAAAIALVERADTFYIASMHRGEAGAGEPRNRGVDVSHRGGKPGFVKVGADGTLTVPDYFGNFFFNTLGNLLLDPRAGLLFLDFEQGGWLQVAVEAEVIWDGPKVAASPGAQRLLRFTVREVRRADGVLPLAWGPAEPSPALDFGA